MFYFDFFDKACPGNMTEFNLSVTVAVNQGCHGLQLEFLNNQLKPWHPCALTNSDLTAFPDAYQ